MQDLERVRFVVRHFSVLQGLKQVPLGCYLLLVAVGNTGLWPAYEVWQPISGLIALGLAVAIYWSINEYYKRAFGRVIQAEDWTRERETIAVVLALMSAFFVDIVIAPPISMVGLVIAAWFFVGWWDERELRGHYGATAGLLVLVSLLPLTGVVRPEQQFAVVLPAVLGITMLVNGTVDHLLLRRLLPPTGRGQRAS